MPGAVRRRQTGHAPPDLSGLKLEPHPRGEPRTPCSAASLALALCLAEAAWAKNKLKKIKMLSRTTFVLISMASAGANGDRAVAPKTRR